MINNNNNNLLYYIINLNLNKKLISYFIKKLELLFF
jgi:hypothetical protein